MNKTIKQNQKGGTAILMVVLIMTSFMAVALTMSDLVINGFRMDRTQLESTKAYFAAETGAEQVIWEIRKNSFNTVSCVDEEYVDYTAGSCDTSDCCLISIKKYSLGNGASYSIKYNYSAPTTTLSSVGGFGDVQRKVELKY